VVKLLGVDAAGGGVQTCGQVILQVTGKQNAGSKTSLAGVKADMKHSFIKTGADYTRYP
jgi:hypothetical protein